MLSWDVIVIGGGAAGMMAAGVAASRGKKILLLERNNKLGRKLFITGKGRCNITNAEDIGDFMKNIPRNPKFLYSALYSFTNIDLINFFEKLGLPLKVEQGRRVFPRSDKSSDVIKAFENFLTFNKVDIRLNARVKEILIEGGEIKGVRLFNNRIFRGEKVIITTGGASYTDTGSTGDGYAIAKNLGHTIIDLEPSLVPIEISEEWVQKVQGLALKSVTVSVIMDNKKVCEEFGEMLFTHFGVSGPIILTLSSCVKQYLSKNEKPLLSLDLKPALTNEMLDKRVQRDFEKYSRRHLRNSLDELLPKKLIPLILSLSEIDGDKYVSSITKEERRKLVSMLKNIPMTVNSLRPLEEAIVTSGGVSTKEIDSSTMQSKLVEGLYFAGEIIDVDAYTGGYNLQIAFSTGYIAGENV